ncbi:MAG TPA: glycosyltransferase family 1 protein [Solirubrobacteraceae bacterium]
MQRQVLINARVAARVTISGVERWAIELIPRLCALAPERYVVARAPLRAASGPLGQLWEQSVLPLQAARSRAGLIFSPANLAPLAWPRNVVIVHDAAAFRRPDAYTSSYASWHRRLGARSARRALRVVTVSEFSKRELVDLIGLDPANVHVIRGGVSERFSTRADSDRVRARFGLRRRYVLTVGTADQRKNLAALSIAARRLAEIGVDLVRAGDARPHFVQPAAVAGVRSLGYVDEHDLPGLYAGASAFVLVSLYEGLGLPCLEAMASGVPVVAARRAALPETCGDAAILVAPEDHQAIAQALERAVDDEQTRRRLRAAGLERAASFNWDRAARELHSLLASVAIAH